MRNFAGAHALSPASSPVAPNSVRAFVASQAHTTASPLDASIGTIIAPHAAYKVTLNLSATNVTPDVSLYVAYCTSYCSGGPNDPSSGSSGGGGKAQVVHPYAVVSGGGDDSSPAVFLAPNPDGTYSVNLPDGDYQFTVVAISGNVALSTSYSSVFTVAGAPLSVVMSLDVPTTTVSGTVHLIDPSGNPVNIADPSNAGSLVVTMLCEADNQACLTSPATYYTVASTFSIDTPIGNGEYTYSIKAPAGDYSVVSLYIDLTAYSQTPPVSSIDPISLTTSVVDDQVLSTAQANGSITITNLPSGVTVYPVVVACSATPVTPTNCASADTTRLNASLSPTTDLVVMAPGETHYSLAAAGATYAAAGWIEDGLLYLDSSSTVAFDPNNPPALTTTYNAPSITGTVTTSPAGSPSYVEACPADMWRAGACTSATAQAIATDPSGHYGMDITPGNYAVYAVAEQLIGDQNVADFSTSNVQFATIGTDPTNLDFNVGFAGTMLSGSIDTGNVPTGDVGVLACPGIYDVTVLLATGCPGFGHLEITSSSYDFRLSAGTWTIYFFTEYAESMGSFTISVNGSGVATHDVVLNAPAVGIYGELTLTKTSQSLWTQTASVIACPGTFSLTCKGLVATLARNNPTSNESISHVGSGLYTMRLFPGTYHVAEVLPEADGVVIGKVRTVTVRDSKYLPLSAVDRATTLLGNVYDLSGNTNAGYVVTACPTIDAFAVGCAGGASESTTGYFALALSPGTYTLTATAIDTGGVITTGTPQTVTISNVRSYTDAFVTGASWDLSGTMSMSGAGIGSTMLVRACPANDTFSSTCAGGLTSQDPENSFILASVLKPSFNQLLGYSSYVGVAGPYATGFEYHLVLASGDYQVAAGFTNTDGSTSWGTPQAVSVTTGGHASQDIAVTS
jgi:hypothetical protein